MLATILVNRGIIEEKQIEKFLNPKRSDFYNPYEMPDMEIAVKRIVKAIENKEKTIRRVSLLGSPFWFVYNFLSKAMT